MIKTPLSPVPDTGGMSHDSFAGRQFLYHGTGEDQADGILHEGIRPSISGSWGPGVYLTEEEDVADNYAKHGYVRAATLRGTWDAKNPKTFNTPREVNDYLGSNGLASLDLTTSLEKDGYDGVNLAHKKVRIGFGHGSFHPTGIRNPRDNVDPWTDLT